VFVPLNFLASLIQLSEQTIASIDQILYTFLFFWVFLAIAPLIIPFVILVDMFIEGHILEGVLVIPIYSFCVLAAAASDQKSANKNNTGWFIILFPLAVGTFFLWTVKLVMVIASVVFAGYVHLAELAQVSIASCVCHLGHRMVPDQEDGALGY